MSEEGTQQAPARWKLWVGAALFVFLTLSFPVLTQKAAPAPPKSSAVQSITEVRVLGDTQGLRRSLPFSPAPNDPLGTATRLRFEVTLEDMVLSMRPSLYVPHFAQATEITVNGQANPTDLPIGARAYNWNRPALVRLDNRHLRAGENVVEIQLSSTSPFSQVYLSRMMVGPYDALAPVWRAHGGPSGSVAAAEHHSVLAVVCHGNPLSLAPERATVWLVCRRDHVCRAV